MKQQITFSLWKRVLLLLVLLVPLSYGYGQTRVSAEYQVSKSDHVDQGSNINTYSNNSATIKAYAGLAASVGSYSGKAVAKFPKSIAANITTYVEISDSQNGALDAILGGGLGGLLDGVLDAVLGGSASGVIEVSGPSGSLIINTSELSSFNSDEVRAYKSANGNIIIGITPNFVYDTVSVTYKPSFTLLLGARFNLSLYNIYAYPEGHAELCGKPFGTSFDGSGLDLKVLQLGDQNLGNAIDSDLDSYSSLSNASLLSLNVGGTLVQKFYFAGLSTQEGTFNITLGGSSSGALNVNLLGGLEVLAYNGDQEVYRRPLSGGLLNGINVLDLFKKDKGTLTFSPGIQYDRIEVRLSSTADVGLIQEGIRIYDVERFDVDCPNPLIVTPAPTQTPFSAPVCAENLITHSNVDFATNVIDGNNESFATLQASGSGLLGLGNSTSGELHVGFNRTVPAGTTSYMRIETGDDSLGQLLGGTLGSVLGAVGDVLFGGFEFDVEVFNQNTSLFTGKTSDGFKSTNGKIKVVQDNVGRYYLAIRADQAYSSVKIKTRLVGALLNSGVTKSMQVYNLCFESDNDSCGAVPFTSFDGSGLDVSLLNLNDQLLQNAIDVTPIGGIANEHMDTASVLKAGGLLNVTVGGSLSQFFYFNSLSPANATFNIKLGSSTSVLDASLLGGLEVYAYNGDEQVYRRPLSGGLINGLDVLTLLKDGPATLTFAPGKQFDRIEVRMNSVADIGLIGKGIEIYDVERFNDTCPNPLVKEVAPTESPFVDASCATELGVFNNVDFATNAIDGNNESFAIMYANNGGLLGSQSNASSVLELKYNQNIGADKTSYIRIDTDKALLDKLVGGTLGDLLGTVTDLVLGDFYFDVTVLNNGASVVTGSSINKFSAADGKINLVQDNIGRNYIAIAPGLNYDAVKIELFVGGALLSSGATKTMSVYNMCHELSTDPCVAAKFTSYDISGLNLSITNLGNANVTDPFKAISGNSSDFSTINTGTVAVGTKVMQTVYFSTPSTTGDQLDIRIQLKSPSTLDVSLLGTIKVYTYLGATQKQVFTLDQAIVKGLDLLSLLGKGSPTTLSFETVDLFDRVVIENTSSVGVSLAEGVRLYSVKRSNDVCKDESAPTPFIDPVCASELIDSENIDFVDNLFDADFNSYATLYSGAGFLLGLGDYQGSVHLGYSDVVKGGTTSYMRIDFEGTEIDKLLGGSLGNLVGDLVGGLLTGKHYFTVEALDANKNAIMKVSTTSDANENSLPEGKVKVVIDALGRHYLAITPKADYKSIRITDKTRSVVGALAVENSMNVYGLCYETTTETCFPSFATSIDFKGLNISVDPLSGAGVTHPERAIDDNTTHHSSLSLGTLAIGAEVQQIVYFNSVSDAGEVVNFKFKTGGGAVDLSVLGGIQLSAYLGDTHVQTLDWSDPALIDGLTVSSVLSNGGTADVNFKVTGGKFDRVSISLRSLVGVTVIPSLEVYNIARDCDVLENDVVVWKSYVVDGDPKIDTVGGEEEIEYTIHVGNIGFGDLSTYTVSDVLPQGVSYVSGGTFANGSVSFTFDAQNGNGPLKTGEVNTHSFKVKVDSNLGDIEFIKNIATVKLPLIDKQWKSFPPVDNTNPSTPDISKEPGTIIAVAKNYDFTIEKVGYATNADGSAKADSHIAVAGDKIIYTITITNTGTKDLNDIIVSDIIQNTSNVQVTKIPEHSNSDYQWTADTSQIDRYTLTVGNIAAGMSKSVEIAVDVVKVSNSETILNKATAQYTSPTNNTIFKETEHEMGSLCTDITSDAIELVSINDVCSGIETSFEVKVKDSFAAVMQNVVFSWYDNSALTGTPLAVGNIYNAAFTTNKTLYVKVEALGFCFDGNAFEIQVTPKPTPVAPILLASSVDVCFGETVVLTADNTVGDHAVYKWYLNGKEIFDSSSIIPSNDPDAPVQKVNELTVNQGGTYTVSVSNGQCFSLPSNSVTVTVAQEIDITITGAQQYSIPFAGVDQKTSITLPIASSATVGATIIWYDQDGNVIDPTQEVIFTGPGTYSFYVTATVGDCSVFEQVIVTVYDMSECFDPRTRVYATSQSWGSIITGGVANRPNAVDGNPKTYSTITTGVGLLGIGTTWQNLYFDHTVPAGTPVTIKLGKEYSGLVLAGGLSVVGIGENNLDIGVIKSVKGGLLDLLAADNVVEFTFVPSNTRGAQPYKGVRISQGSLVGVAQLAKLYGAYYHRDANSEDEICSTIDENTKENVLDVLHGVEDIGLGVASATASVSNPWAAVDNDPDSYAMMSRGVAVLNRASLTVVFKQAAMPGDELHIVTETPINPILSLELIKGYKIQRYMGDREVGASLDGGIDVLGLKLLGLGYKGKSKIIVAPFDEPYDRVKISYGSVVGVIGDFTKIFDVDLVPSIDSIVPDHNGDYNKHMCEGGDLDLLLPDDCTAFIVYKDADKNDFYDSTGQNGRNQTFDVSELEAGKTHIVYVQSTRNGCAVGPLIPVNLTISKSPEFKEYVLNGTDILADADQNGNFEFDLPTRSLITLDARSMEFESITKVDPASVTWEIAQEDANGIVSWLPISSSVFATEKEGQLTIEIPAMGVIDGIDFSDTTVKVRAVLGLEYTPWANITPEGTDLDPIIPPYTCLTIAPEISIHVGNGKKSAIKSNLNVTHKIK